MNPLAFCILPRVEESQDCVADLFREKRRYGIANLNKLFSSIALEEVVVRKCLQARSFSDCEGSALRWVWMNKVVSILGDVARNRCGWLSLELHPETVVEVT